MDEDMVDTMGAPPDDEFQEQQRIEYEKDTKIKRAAKIKFKEEDHTLGNLLRMQLLRDETVIFAGYMIRHPLENEMVIKVQTKESNHPLKAVIAACDDLQKEIISLSNSFKMELYRKLLQAIRRVKGSTRGTTMGISVVDSCYPYMNWLTVSF